MRLFFLLYFNCSALYQLLLLILILIYNIYIIYNIVGVLFIILSLFQVILYQHPIDINLIIQLFILYPDCRKRDNPIRLGLIVIVQLAQPFFAPIYPSMKADTTYGSIIVHPVLTIR